MWQSGITFSESKVKEWCHEHCGYPTVIVMIDGLVEHLNAKIHENQWFMISELSFQFLKFNN